MALKPTATELIELGWTKAGAHFLLEKWDTSENVEIKKLLRKAVRKMRDRKFVQSARRWTK